MLYVPRGKTHRSHVCLINRSEAFSFIIFFTLYALRLGSFTRVVFPQITHISFFPLHPQPFFQLKQEKVDECVAKGERVSIKPFQLVPSLSPQSINK